MSIIIYTGLCGAGKSMMLAKTGLDLLWRNMKWYKKTGIIRYVVSNLKFQPKIEQVYSKFIKYWEEPAELISMRDCDILFDEVATHLDSTQWANMSLDLKRWLQQHRKFGIDIYGTTQDFGQVDISVRRLTNEVYLLRKLIGSRDKSATTPPVTFFWGLIMIKTFDPIKYKVEEPKEGLAMLPTFMVIRKELVQAFDTTQEIKRGQYPPLNHTERFCSYPNCDFHKVIHA
jgi:hypothetical protein